MRVSLANSGRAFSAIPGRSVLDAALAAGLNLPHSCKAGKCGSCRARLVSGDIHYPLAPLALSGEEIAGGMILLCQARARSDLVVDLPETRFADEVTIKRLPCRIDHTVRLSHDVMAVFLRLPAAESFSFEPGQYVDVMLSGGRRRSFSIASPPHDARLLELHVRRVAGGEFTERMFSEPVRDGLLTIEGPLGRFVYRPSATGMLLIGGGTGLAPLQSMLRHVVDHALPRAMRLYWGVRGEGDLYADAALHELERKAGSLRYVPVLSDPPPHWQGRRGLVHEAALRDLDAGELGDAGNWDVYTAGPPALVDAVRREAAARGLAPERVYFDSFDYAPDSLERQLSNAATRS
jgi:CDP-4-dehydro-6-deoxyglucose reductase